MHGPPLFDKGDSVAKNGEHLITVQPCSLDFLKDALPSYGRSLSSANL